MGDYSVRDPRDVEPGDEVLGAIQSPGARTRYGRAEVVRLHRSRREALWALVGDREVVLPLGAEVWCVGSRWAPVEEAVRRTLRVLGEPLGEDEPYRRGWVAGAADGDGSFWWDRRYRQFRLCKPGERPLLVRFWYYLDRFGIRSHWGRHQYRGFGLEVQRCEALYCRTHREAVRLEEMVRADDMGSSAWRTGYLAGLLDTDGGCDGGTIRWWQQKLSVRDRLLRVGAAHGLDLQEEEKSIRARLGSGTTEFVLSLGLAVTRKTDEAVLRTLTGERVLRALGPAGIQDLTTFTTTCGSYLVDGVLVRDRLAA